MNATSRDRRQSFATTTGAFAFRAFASASASFGRRSKRVGSLAGLDLDELGEHLAPLGGGEPGDGLALGFDPQAALALLACRYPDVADNLAA